MDATAAAISTPITPLPRFNVNGDIPAQLTVIEKAIEEKLSSFAQIVTDLASYKDQFAFQLEALKANAKEGGDILDIEDEEDAFSGLLKSKPKTKAALSRALALIKYTGAIFQAIRELEDIVSLKQKIGNRWIESQALRNQMKKQIGTANKVACFVELILQNDAEMLTNTDIRAFRNRRSFSPCGFMHMECAQPRSYDDDFDDDLDMDSPAAEAAKSITDVPTGGAKKRTRKTGPKG